MSKYAGRATHCIIEGCGIELKSHPRDRKTDLCKKHVNLDPQRRANVSAAIKLKHQDPEYRAKYKHSAVVKRTLAARPELREIYRENMRKVGKEHGGSVAGSDERRRASMNAVNTRLKDVPLEYRDEYRTLMRSHRIPRADRVKMIQQQMTKDQGLFERTGELQATKGRR